MRLTFSFIPTITWLSLIAIPTMASPASADNGDSCEAKWSANSAQFVNQENPDYSGLLAYWQQQASECKGTGAYEARLAVIYLYLDQPREARSALEQARKRRSRYASLIELVAFMSESFALVAQSPIDEVKMEEFGKRVYAYASRNPERADVLAYAGGIQTTLGHHDRAIALLEKALALSKAGQPISLAGLYRNATISYAALQRYSEAYDAGGAALSENKGVMADAEFMYAVINTQAELGQLDAAKTSAEVLVAKTPAVRTDPEFAALVAYLKDKFKAAAK